jgi:hypothetical protein
MNVERLWGVRTAMILLLVAGSSASAWLGAGCGGDGTTCGDGTVLRGGVCVIEGSGGAGSGDASTPPVTPDAAWRLSMAGGGSTCDLASSTRQLGDVGSPSDPAVPTSITDQSPVCATSDGFSLCPNGSTGTTAASVTCSVVQSGSTFAVKASASAGADSLSIAIASLTTGATMANPAVGTVTYQSDSTVSVFSSATCDFYFASGNEGVGPGKVWVAFTCAGITSAAAMATCPVIESYAVFENCSTSP